MDISTRPNPPSPPAGKIRLLNIDNELWAIDPNGQLTKVLQTGGTGFSPDAAYVFVNGQWHEAVHEGEPSNHMTGNSTPASAAFLEVVNSGLDNNLTFTAVAPGGTGNDLMITLLDPSGDSQPMSVYLDEINPLKVCVNLATEAGDLGGAIVATEGDPIIAMLDEAGSAAADGKSVALTLATILDPFGNEFPDPAGTLGAAVDGDTYVVNLTADGGAAGVLDLTEDSLSAGSLTISQTAGFAGAWGNGGAVQARVLVNPTPSTARNCVASLGESVISITVYLETDADGLPVAVSDDDLADDINAALATAELDGYLVAASATAGDFDTATAGWVTMGSEDGGVDGVDAAPSGDTAEDVATEIAGLTGISEAVAETPADMVSSTGVFSFIGGGENYGITTTAADIVSAFTDPDDPLYNADVAALMTAELTGGDGGDGIGAGVVEALPETNLAEGSDMMILQVETIGTPGWLGRIATDGTDIWTCMLPNMNGLSPNAWVRTYSGGG
jgi:hypothetical protein